MQDFNPNRAILAGFVATLVMTLFAFAGPVVGLPKMDYAALLGGALFGADAQTPFTISWWGGMVLHFFNGAIIFPLIYAYLLFSLLPGSHSVKGTLWGTLLWLISETLVLPIMGIGFFSAGSPRPVIWVIANFIAHLVYGALLGAIAARQRIPLPGTEKYMVESREREHHYRMRNKLQRKG